MASRLPSFIKLPGHNVFEYKPRYYKEGLQKDSERISFRKKDFQEESKIYSAFHREKADIRRKYALFSRLIRIAIIILLVVIAYLIAKGMGIIWELSK
jgi:hypothetical protein